jgi:hypothetical protein
MAKGYRYSTLIGVGTNMNMQANYTVGGVKATPRTGSRLGA